MAFVLPFPPSANRLWRAVNGRAIKSREYRAWLEEAALVARSQRPVAVRGAYHIRLVARRPDNRRRDLGNLEKPVSDLLTEIGVIEDDSLAKSISLFWADGPARKPGSILVSVEAA